MNKHLKIWIRQTKLAFYQQITSKSSAFLFLFGKLFRFIMYLLFLFFLIEKTQTLAGYTLPQVLLIFLVFTLVDSLTQFLFRGAYMFRPLVVQGGFDYLLVQPANPLFRSLTRFTDIFDFVTIFPLALYISWYVSSQHLFTSITSIIFFVTLIFNAFLIGTAAHIAILAIGILYLEVDSALWIYRDLTAMGRFPIEVYKEPVRSALTFIIPLGVMFLFPAKALFGQLSITLLITSLIVGPALTYLSLKFWQHALSRYSSASS